jgi:hypothetical protein
MAVAPTHYVTGVVDGTDVMLVTVIVKLNVQAEVPGGTAI